MSEPRAWWGCQECRFSTGKQSSLDDAKKEHSLMTNYRCKNSLVPLYERDAVKMEIADFIEGLELEAFQGSWNVCDDHERANTIVKALQENIAGRVRALKETRDVAAS